MKLNLIFKTFLALLVLASQTFAAQVGFYVRAGNHSVNVTLNDRTGDYTYDLGKHFQPELTLRDETKHSLNCADVKEYAEASGGIIPPSEYQTSARNIEVQLFDLPNATDLDGAVRAALEVSKMKLTRIHNVSNLVTEKVTLKFAWDTNALTMIAGDKVIFDAESQLQNAISHPNAKNAINKYGVVEIKSTLSTLLCDLVNKKVRIEVSYDGYQSDDIKIPTRVSASDLKSINRAVVAQSHLLQNKSQGVSSIGSEKAEIINAAGLLALEFAKKGYSAAIITQNEFVATFNKFYGQNYTKPSTLNDSEIESLVESLMQNVFSPREIRFTNQKLKIEVK